MLYIKKTSNNTCLFRGISEPRRSIDARKTNQRLEQKEKGGVDSRGLGRSFAFGAFRSSFDKLRMNGNN